MIGNRFEGLGVIASVFAVVTMVGCGAGETPDGATENVARTGGTLSFDEWKETVRLRPGRDVYAVGDRVTPLGLVGDGEAYGYYQRHVASREALTIHNGQTAPGTPVNVSAFPRDYSLSYCIDRTGFEQVAIDYGLPSGTDLYTYVENAFRAPVAAWNEVLDIQIHYKPDRSTSCTPRTNDTITWYVRPLVLEDPLRYLTFVLPPHHNRTGPDLREFLVLDYLIQRPFPGAFVLANEPDWDDIFSMEELLLRAIANGLGFIDETNRGGVASDLGSEFWPGICRDTSLGGVFLTEADLFSVTSHPIAMAPLMPVEKRQCVGQRDKGYALSYLDVMGAACQYRRSNLLYYCSLQAQYEISAKYPADCGPYPLSVNGTGYCGSDSDSATWQNLSRAQGVHSAILTALR